MKNTIDLCPLCTCERAVFFSKDRFREYYHCPECDLIFVPSQYHLTPQQEKERYDLHENDPQNLGYRKFLSTLVNPLAEIVPKGSLGLDFGSGPEPVMANMLKDLGYEIVLYDKYYANDSKALDQQYDFITCCETIEHFSNPKKELELMLRILKPGGWLGIKTNLYDFKSQTFDNWHYKRDLTHVCFFSIITIYKFIEQYDLSLKYHNKSNLIFSILS
jgi:SAM-dependent methyltransferase